MSNEEYQRKEFWEYPDNPWIDYKQWLIYRYFIVRDPEELPEKYKEEILNLFKDANKK